MAGIAPDTPIPSDIRLHKKSRVLELCYEDGARYEGQRVIRSLLAQIPPAPAAGCSSISTVIRTRSRGSNSVTCWTPPIWRDQTMS